MKKNIVKYIVSILLCGVLIVGYGCVAKPQDNTNDDTDSILINSGISEYSIVIPQAPKGSELSAADVIKEYLFKSTGCELKINSDADIAYTKNSKIISIGETSAYNSTSLNINTEALKADGFSIKAKDKSVFIIAGFSDEAYIYSAHTFLNKVIGFEAYSYDEIYYDYFLKLKLPELDITEVPSFEKRHLYNADIWLAPNVTLYRNFLRNKDINWGPVGGGHTVYKLLPPSKYLEAHPEWYTGITQRDQLDFSNPELRDELVDVVISYVRTNKDVTNVMIGQNDHSEWYKNQANDEAFELYGSNSGILIQTMNYVARAVKEYINENEPGRVVYITTFAYTTTEKPPVKKDANGNWVAIDETVIPDDNVAIRLAPIYTDYSYDFSHTVNEGYKDNIEGWSAITDNILIWNYNYYSQCFFMPMINYNTISSIYQFYYNNNVTSVWEEGARAPHLGFVKFQNYLSSKLMWNVYADEATLTNNFFKTYYRDGGEGMLKYFNEYREWFNIAEKNFTKINGYIESSVHTATEAFPLNLVEKWEGYLNQAKASIEYLRDIDLELYTKIYNRIDVESLFFDYVRIFNFPTEFPAQTLRQMRIAFKEKCILHGVTRFSNQTTMDSIYASWGV